MGTINPIAKNVPDFAEGLKEGRLGVTNVTRFDVSDFEVKWEENTNASWTPSNSTLSTNLADYLSYNSTTNCWEVRVNLTQIGTSQTGPYRDYIIITGMSGAGKSQAASILETASPRE